MEKGAPAFSKARYVFGQAEYDFWADEKRVGTPAEAAIRVFWPASSRWRKRRPSSVMVAMSCPASPALQLSVIRLAI